jgi:uncharacterized protein
MAEITLLAKSQAQPGFPFVYQGGAPPCRPCPYRNACLTLDIGRRYVVRKVRPVEHPCALQETQANVVEVERVPRALLVEHRAAIPGSTVETGRYSCPRIDCPNWDDCAGPSLPPRQRYQIVQVHPETAECRIGRTLKRVEAV